MRGVVLVMLGGLLGSPAVADEVVLKNGKTIEWTSMKDLGDTYEIETKSGETLKVDKGDIARVVVIPPRGAGPLTGAAFLFDKKTKLETRDLLAGIEPKRDTVTGDWKKAGNSITGTPEPQTIARLQIPNFAVPDEYDVTLVAERKSGANQLALGLISPLGKRFLVGLDAVNSSWTGLAFTDKKQTEEKASVPGKFFENGKARTIQIMVRKDAFVLQADGKDFVVWKGDWARVSVPEGNGWATPNEKSMFLGVVNGASYTISRLTITLPRL